MTLSHLDVRLLEFEAAHPRHTGLKTDAILHRLGMSSNHYYDRLRRLVRTREVQDRYPHIASRIERADARRRERRQAFDRFR